MARRRADVLRSHIGGGCGASAGCSAERSRSLSEAQILGLFPDGERAVSLIDPGLSRFDGSRNPTGGLVYFRHDGGVIVGENTGFYQADPPPPEASTYLMTRRPYKDFRFIFEAKLHEGSEMHTGVGIWGRQYPFKGETHSYQGHLVLWPEPWGLFELYRRNWHTGSVSGNWILRDCGAARQAGHQHGWNRIEILAKAGRLRVAVNGVCTLDFLEPDPSTVAAGPIALQHHWRKEGDGAGQMAQKVEWRALHIADDPVTDRLATVL
eukprot:TRINITY_DN31333_c0_g1_i1.p1 TRINITY_DN31333_c0_g1~~TRINITY_DN31333_c0_g1_i1.p1  ORF type:complete len:266 (+),score=63.63 TRINITY_DN31333_c0_g1_i1:55-852(+)